MAKIETYLPLYRKYRPQSFADLVGQEAITLTLGNAINLSKVAHAYLFCGPRGTGKTSTARIFAKSLNCEQGPTVSPCQVCPSCIGITEGNALDVIEFDAASNNGVEDARELIESCQFAPIAGRFKIYIIDEVHMLTSQAFNALLKTLEEPPASVVFIFATTEAHKVLPTIISRCQRFDFNRITSEGIVNRLNYIAEQEAIRIEGDALDVIARHARGGLRDAVGLLDQVAVLGRAQPDAVISRQDVALLIGTLEEEILFQLVEAIAKRQAPELLSGLSQLVNRGVEPLQLLKELIQHFRNLLLVKAVGPNADPKTLSFPADYFQRLHEQSVEFVSEELPQILSRLAAIERNVRNTQQPHLWLEVGLLELAYREEIYLVQELAKRVSALEEQLKSGMSVARNPEASCSVYSTSSSVLQAPQSLAASVMPSRLEEASRPEETPKSVPAQQMVIKPLSSSGSDAVIWSDICEKVASPMTKSLLKQHTFLMKRDDAQVTVGCSSEPILDILKRPDKFIHLQKAVEGYFGHPMKIEVILEKERPVTENLPPQVSSQRPQLMQSTQESGPVLPLVSETVDAMVTVGAPVNERVSEPLMETPLEPIQESVERHQSIESLPPIPESLRETAIQETQSQDLMEAKRFTMDLLQGKVIE